MKKNFFVVLAGLFLNLESTAQVGFNKVVDSSNPVTTFTSAGIYKGVAWVDFDNDDDVDLFAAPNFIFRNDGSGTFFQITNPFGFTPLQNTGGSSWADLNSDGFIDCIIANYPSGVYLNDGTGTFTDVSSSIPNLNGFPSWAGAIGDWNKDAYPDFVFVHAGGFHPAGPFPSKLYLNTTSSVTPQYITGYTLTDSVKPYTVPYWSDYDLDGDMDLFVASGPVASPGPDFCYKNLKTETGLDTLQVMTTELFASQLQDGQCYNFIDFDNDGDLDLCLTNYTAAPSRFYVNNAGVYSVQAMPFTSLPRSLANNWGDFDNDGDLDVMITNDQVQTKYYINNGNGIFSAAVNLGSPVSAGISNGDYDNDGDLDVFIHGTNSARALFRNDSAATGNNWINIKCIGTVSNKSALGTIVKLKATINGNPYWQTREINAQNSFQSQNDLRVHFGLGNALIADSLIIKYPGGAIETFTNVAPNIFYCNVEGSNSLCLIAAISEATHLENLFQIYPNPASEFIHINSLQDNISLIEITNTLGKVLLSKKINNKNEKVMLDDIPSGAYFLEATSSSGKRSVSKLLVVKK